MNLKKVAAILALLAVLLIAGIYVFKKQSDNGDSDAAGASTTSVSAQTSISAAPETSAPPMLSAVNAGKEPALVGTFTMDGPAPINGATYDSMPYALPLNPAGPQDTMVRWVDGWGSTPYNAEVGTMYILGHAWGQQRLVFNPISELVTAKVDFSKPMEQVPAVSGGTVGRYSTPALNGSTITMKDAEGNAREWTVDNSWLVDKNDAIEDLELTDENIPGRIVLIACSVDGANQDLDYNVIVSGHLKTQ